MSHTIVHKCRVQKQKVFHWVISGQICKEDNEKKQLSGVNGVCDVHDTECSFPLWLLPLAWLNSAPSFWWGLWHLSPVFRHVSTVSFLLPSALIHLTDDAELYLGDPHQPCCWLSFLAWPQTCLITTHCHEDLDLGEAWLPLLALPCSPHLGTGLWLVRSLLCWPWDTFSSQLTLP